MKNLFKNLMLVAVAAMAFTACTETNDEVNAVSKTTRYEFTANIAEETRSGFAEKEEGATAYKSEWFGNETLMLVVNDNNGYYVETTATIDAEGKFDLELTDAPEFFFMTVNSPADSWSSEYSCTIPAEQTPLENSVDPKAHLLQHAALPVSNGVAEINLTHQAAYGKMTVNGVDFAIDHVVVDLKGSFYSSNRELSYTINATYVDNNTFWFATEPVDVAEFTVTAYGAGDEVVTKTVDMTGKEKPLAFGYGRVSTFSVSGLEEYVEPEPEPTPDPSTAPKFAGAKVFQKYGSTDYKIQLTGDGAVLHNLIFNLMGTPAYTYVSADSTYLNAGTYDTDYGKDSVIDPGYSAYNNMAIDDIKVTVEHVDEGYYIVVENVVMDGNVVIPMATYTGLIDGFSAPWASVDDEPDQPSGDVTELTITEHATIYRSGPEHELGFYYAPGKMVDIDFLANPIVPGTYTLAVGLSDMYCKSHGGSMQECKVVVTDAGDGKLTFDATFKVNDKSYHFTYTAQIYA